MKTKMNGGMIMININSEYFTSSTRGVHVSDKEVQKMVDEVIKTLQTSKDNFDFASQETGDTIVWGTKYDGNTIDVYISQNYSSACFVSDDYGKTWEPINWQEENEYEILSSLDKEELIEEIMRLKHADYNPNREI